MRDLAHRYAAAVDDRDFAGVAALFAPDGVLVTARPPGRLDPSYAFVGPGGVLEAMRLLDGVTRTFHAVVGQVYDGTRGRIACVAHHVVDETDHVWHLRYLDDYVETADGWRFARREVHVDLVQALPVVAVRDGSPAPT